MTTFGVTPTGFVLKTFADIQQSLFAYWRSKISKLLQLTEKTGLGNVGNGAADQLAEAWEAVQTAYYANDPDNADDASFIALCALTGTIQEGASGGTVTANCTLAGPATYPVGALVANVAGQAANRWSNRDVIVTPNAITVPVVFTSEIIGAGAVALAGTLTAIAQPYAGWTAVTNVADADPGRDVESIENLAIRREQELQGSGSGPLAAVRAKVSAVAGVQSVKARQNVTGTPGINGLPIKSYQIIVWDGVSPAATNDTIAQAILNSGPAGIQSVGQASGNAVDSDGTVVSFNFDRARQVPVYVSVTVTGAVAIADVQAAIVAAGAKMQTGVVYAKLSAAAADVAGVNDVTSLTVGLAASPTGTVNIAVDFAATALFDASRISVTVV